MESHTDTLTESQILGARIRSLRQDRNLTMDTLASRTGVSTSLISQVERGKAEPSLNTLRKIADTFGISVGALFGTQSSDGSGDEDNVVRRNRRKKFKIPGTGVVCELLVPDRSSNLEVVYTELPPGARVPYESAEHDGVETIVCLEGELSCRHVDDEYTLMSGDAITWNPSESHQIWNESGDVVKVLAAVSPNQPAE